MGAPGSSTADGPLFWPSDSVPAGERIRADCLRLPWRHTDLRVCEVKIL